MSFATDVPAADAPAGEWRQWREKQARLEAEKAAEVSRKKSLTAPLTFWKVAFAVLAGNLLTAVLFAGVYYFAVQLPKERADEALGREQLMEMQVQQKAEADELAAATESAAPEKEGRRDASRRRVEAPPVPSVYAPGSSPAEVALRLCNDPCSLVAEAERGSCSALGTTEAEVAFLNAHLPAGMAKVTCGP